EKLTAYLLNAFLVKLEVVPRSCIADHVPACGVGAVFFDGFERIYGIAQTLGHLVAILVKYQAVRHHVLERDGLFEHGGNSVEREEPSAGLVYALSDEVGRVGPFEAV